MRTAFLTALLFSAASQAQPVAPPEATRHAGVVPLAVGGTVGGAAGGFGALVAVLYLPVNDAAGLLLIEAGYALGTGAGVALAGEILGGDGSAGRAIRDAAIGGALVMVTTAGLILVLDDEKSDVLAALPIGLTMVAVVPLVLSVRGYRLAPAALAAPTGERGAGLSLRVGL